jgi:hypothetical protein
MTMKTSTYYWLFPTLLLGASSAFAGCSNEPFSLGEDAGDSGGEPAHAGSSLTGGKGGASSSGGSSGGSSVGGSAPAGGGGSVTCLQSDCGPQLGLPNWTCDDGSTAGPTGRCLSSANGSCAWEVLNCPTGVGQAGAPSVGGSSSTGGSTSNGGAGSDECGGCVGDEICIYQVGGPGPSHFACAVQNPCGAQATCACIVNQGTCEPELAADGYCHCDNGLE